MSGDAARSARKVRADGQRNRTAILETARRIFAEHGADTSLDQIARAAGVGNGTLYRHFPTRGVLVDAVCYDDARDLVAAASALAGDQPPLIALLRWMDVFIDHIASRNIVVETVTMLIGSPADTNADVASGAGVRAALLTLFDRAVASGDIQVAFDPLDLLRAIAGLKMTGSQTDWTHDAKRLVRVLVAGLQKPLPPF